MAPNARARSLAAAFARNDKPLVDLYLSQEKKFFNFGRAQSVEHIGCDART